MKKTIIYTANKSKDSELMLNDAYILHIPHSIEKMANEII